MIHNNTTIQAAPIKKNSFPWGLFVGAIRPVLRDSTSFLPPSAVNALIPTNTGGVVIHYSEADQLTIAVNLIESAVLGVLECLPPHSVEISIIDFSLRKRFSNLAKLLKREKPVVYVQEQEANKALESLELLVRKRHHDFLDDETTDISSLNSRISAGAIERYHLLLLNLNHFPLKKETQLRLWQLLEAGFSAGLYFIAYLDPHQPPQYLENQVLGDPSIQRNSHNETLQFWESLTRNFTCIKMQEKTEATADINIILQGKTGVLHEWLQLNQKSIVYKPLDANTLVVQRLQKQLADAAAIEVDFLNVPIGFLPNHRDKAYFSLGKKSDCYSALVLGMSGSGKSNMLNNLIVNIAENYTAQEIVLYLMDYKMGTEFQVFKHHPNCAQILLDNQNLDAAINLLNEFTKQMDSRGHLFLTAGVKDIDAYNELNPSSKIPRVLLVVDEVQRLLLRDRNGQQFLDQIRDVSRRGRSLGIHFILSTQTLLNTELQRDLLSQIGLRIAFKLSLDSDCNQVLDFNNYAPRQLEKYQFILNNEAGLIRANQLVMSDPPSEIEKRIEAARNRKNPDQCIEATVILPVKQDTPTYANEEKSSFNLSGQSVESFHTKVSSVSKEPVLNLVPAVSNREQEIKDLQEAEKKFLAGNFLQVKSLNEKLEDN